MSTASHISTGAAPRALVIGGGISGLACAYRLHQRGVDVHLLECAPRVGGSIQSVSQDGFLLELGPNTYTRKPATDNLIADLGVESDHLTALLREQPRYIYDRGRLQRVPMGPGGLLTTRLLSLSGKLRLLGEPFVRQRPPEEQSVADFVTTHAGPEVLEMFVSPFVSGIYAGDPTQMSMPAAFPLIYGFARRKGSVIRGALAHFGEKKREREKAGTPREKRQPSALCTFRQGLARLPEAIAAALGPRVHSGVSIQRIQLHDRHYQVQSVDVTGQAGLWESEALVIACPAHAACKLVQGVAPAAALALAQVPYTPVMVVHVGAPLASLAVQPRGFGFLVPRGRDVRALGVLFTSAIFQNRAPEGQTLLTLFYGGMSDAGMLKADDKEVEKTALRDLVASMGWNGTQTLLGITRLAQALPAYTLGHVARMQALENATHGLPAPLRFIGNYHSGISLPDCVRRADACAQEVASQLRARA